MSRARVIAMIERYRSWWERRKSRRAMMLLDCSRDLRRSHKTTDIGSAACA